MSAHCRVGVESDRQAPSRNLRRRPHWVVSFVGHPTSSRGKRLTATAMKAGDQSSLDRVRLASSRAATFASRAGEWQSDDASGCRIHTARPTPAGGRSVPVAGARLLSRSAGFHSLSTPPPVLRSVGNSCESWKGLPEKASKSCSSGATSADFAAGTAQECGPGRPPAMSAKSVT